MRLDRIFSYIGHSQTVLLSSIAYRLYTIVPRLLELVDEITNWYIRFNRKRLKGENGQVDTLAALNTLFETLFTLTRTMVISCTSSATNFGQVLI